ncbi:hypothetical protein C2W64_03358 [Brevibacillus laterosporus]|nr:hypothetical protein C2W64_03358 [Brevibacillus laterosporus]
MLSCLFDFYTKTLSFGKKKWKREGKVSYNKGKASRQILQ